MGTGPFRFMVQKLCWIPGKLGIDLNQFAYNQRRTISAVVTTALEKQIYGEEKDWSFYQEESPKEK